MTFTNAEEQEIANEVRYLELKNEAKRRFAAQAERKDAAELRWLSEVEDVPVDWRIWSPDPELTGLLAVGANMLLVADRKVGKSSLALQLIRGYLLGGTLFGAWECEALADDESVGYLNFEVSEGQFAEWARSCGIPENRMAVASLRGMSNPLVVAERRQVLAEQLKAKNCKMLVVDPLGRAYMDTGGGDPNPAMNRFFGELEDLAKDAGISEVIVVHHSDKASAKEGRPSARGASAIEGWADSLVYVRRDSEGMRYLRAEGRDVDVPEAPMPWDSLTRTNTYQTGLMPTETAKSSRSYFKAKVVTDEAARYLQGSITAMSARALAMALPEHAKISHPTLGEYLKADPRFELGAAGWFLRETCRECGEPLLDATLGSVHPTC